VKAGVDVEGVKGGVKGTKAGAKAQAALHVGHQGEEVGDVGAVERLSEFGQHEFAPAGDLGSHDAGAVAPVVLADGDGVSGNRVVGGRRRGIVRRSPLVTPALAAQATVGIAFGLLGLVVAIADVGLGVVFLDPSEDMGQLGWLGVQGHGLSKVVGDGHQFGLQQTDDAIKQELWNLVGHSAQQAGKVTLRG
jgi:hypothetical protein